MDNQQLKALLMAMMSPMGTGAPINDASFKNLNANADRLIKHCIPNPQKGLRIGESASVKDN